MPLGVSWSLPSIPGWRPGSPLPPFSGLVRDSKLETEFHEEYTQHVYYAAEANPHQQKIRKEERWEKCRKLSGGCFGIVRLEKLITDSGEEKFRAVKEIRKGRKQSGAVNYGRELEAIAKFSHERYNVCFVKSLGWYENPGYVFIAMEYFPLGDLQKYLSPPWPEKDAQQIAYQILEGLAFMHGNGFVHGDLKPSNILVQSKTPDWWVKIGDFGISKRAREDLTAFQAFSGTSIFAAPEILAQHGFFGEGDFGAAKGYTMAVDIWSLGEIVFRALTGQQPFPIRSLRTYVQGASSFPTATLRAHGVSEEGSNFLSSLMAPSPENRSTARDALSHVWVEPQDQSSAKVSLEIERTPDPMIEEAASQGCPTTEASAIRKTVDFGSPKPNASVNPEPIGEPPALRVGKNNTNVGQQDKRDEPVASGSGDKTARLRDRVTGAARHTLRGHEGWISSLAFSPDGKLVASASGDKTVRLWDSATGAVRHTLKGHEGPISSMAFSPEGKLVASVSYDKTVRLWDSTTGAAHHTLEGHEHWVSSVVFSPDGRLVASGSEDKTVRLWDSATGSVRHMLKGHKGWVPSMAFSLDGKLVASASGDRTVRLWDTATGSVRHKLKDHEDSVSRVAFSPDGKLVVSGSHDKTVRLWDSVAGAVRHTLRGHKGEIWSLAFSPDGRLVASASHDKTVRLWDIATGAMHHMLNGHGGSVWSAAFSPDGKLVASASSDKTVRLWDSATGALLHTLEGHEDWVSTVVFSLDGQLIASGSSDQTVRLWDLQ